MAQSKTFAPRSTGLSRTAPGMSYAWRDDKSSWYDQYPGGVVIAGQRLWGQPRCMAQRYQECKSSWEQLEWHRMDITVSSWWFVARLLSLLGSVRDYLLISKWCTLVDWNYGKAELPTWTERISRHCCVGVRVPILLMRIMYAIDWLLCIFTAIASDTLSVITFMWAGHRY
jgi:hypothetical protein